MLPSERNFFIAALPRSRTAWLANLLCTADSFCYHEAISRFGFLPELDHKYVGSAETNLDVIPSGHRTLIIHRDLDECHKSLMNSFELPNMVIFEDYERTSYEVMGEQAERLKKVDGMHVDFKDIDSKVEDIWSYLLPDTYIDINRIEEMLRVNIQVFETDLGRLI